jgi:PIN domain nuclease of toxin-antitoxin system
VTVLDAYAVIAYLRGEPCADEVADLLRGGPAVLTSINTAEVRDQMVRVFGADADGMEADLALLCHAGLTVQAVTHELGMQAGRIRARRYHRERAAVSLADCVAAAAALAIDSPLATSDPVLAEVLRSEGGKVRPLPGQQGPTALGLRQSGGRVERNRSEKPVPFGHQGTGLPTGVEMVPDRFPERAEAGTGEAPDESLVDVREPVADHLLVGEGHGLPLTAIKRTSFVG